MAIDQMDIIQAQTASVLRNKTSGSVAKLRADTSLVGQASKLTGRMSRQLDQSLLNGKKESGKNAGVLQKADTVPEAPKKAKIASDGYVRRSAVQAIRVPADYRRRRIRKIVSRVLLVLFLLAALWLLLQTNLMAH